MGRRIVERPDLGYRADMSNSRDQKDPDQGQVSEVSGMDPAESDEPISPEDATAGSPDGESGEPDEGAAGPEASQPENRRDRRV